MNMPFARFSLTVLVDAARGTLMGYYGQCSSGACLLTATWWRGSLYGDFLAALSNRSA